MGEDLGKLIAVNVETGEEIELGTVIEPLKVEPFETDCSCISYRYRY